MNLTRTDIYFHKKKEENNNKQLDAQNALTNTFIIVNYLLTLSLI